MIINLAQIDFAGGGSGGGGTDPNAQHLHTAATKSAAESMTGVTVGDVIFIPQHVEQMAMPQDFYYAITLWGWNFIDALNHYGGININYGYSGNIIFVKVPVASASSDVEGKLIIQDEYEGQYVYYGIRQDSTMPTEYQVLSGGSIDDEWVTLVGDTFTIPIVTGHQYSVYEMSTPDDMFTDNGFGNPILNVSVDKEMSDETLQKNNSSLINLASSDEVASAMTTANNALNEAYSKVPKMEWIGVSSWDDLAQWQVGLYQNLTINNVDEGTRLHNRLASNTELTNPKIEEIMTNRNPGVVPATLRVVSLNQNEYDALVSGGTVSDNTLYIIVDDTKWQGN